MNCCQGSSNWPGMGLPMPGLPVNTQQPVACVSCSKSSLVCIIKASTVWLIGAKASLVIIPDPVIASYCVRGMILLTLVRKAELLRATHEIEVD